MALIVHPSEFKSSTPLKGMIYGEPGIGKTTMALSSPNPVLIDFDKGLKRVAVHHRVPTLTVDNYDQVLDLIKSDELDKFDTIVIDTISKLASRIINFSIRENPKNGRKDGQPTQSGWGDVNSKFTSLFRQLEEKNKSIIFVAHVGEEKDGDNLKKRPDCVKNIRQQIINELDFMGYMQRAGDQTVLCLQPSDQFHAKNSIGTDHYLTVPILGIMDENNFLVEQVFKAYEKKKIYDEEYNQKIQGIKQSIGALHTLGQINDYYKNAILLDDAIANSKFLQKQELMKRLDWLKKQNIANIIFDKTKSEFVEISSENK